MSFLLKMLSQLLKYKLQDKKQLYLLGGGAWIKEHNFFKILPQNPTVHILEKYYRLCDSIV